MIRAIQSFARDESGATAIEYSLIAFLVSIAAFGGMAALGNEVKSILEGVTSTVASATGPALDGLGQ